MGRMLNIVKATIRPDDGTYTIKYLVYDEALDDEAMPLEEWKELNPGNTQFDKYLRLQGTFYEEDDSRVEDESEE